MIKWLRPIIILHPKRHAVYSLPLQSTTLELALGPGTTPELVLDPGTTPKLVLDPGTTLELVLDTGSHCLALNTNPK